MGGGNDFGHGQLTTGSAYKALGKNSPLGGLHPQTQSLWVTDIAHHHRAIAFISTSDNTIDGILIIHVI